MLSCVTILKILVEKITKFVLDSFASNLLAPDSHFAAGGLKSLRDQPMHRRQDGSPGVSPRV